MIPEELSHQIVKNGTEYEQFLEEECTARLYFLDDKVPDSSDEMGSHFIKHHKRLIESHPGARVFYIGLTPSTKTREYCEENGVVIVENKKISDYLQ